MKVLYTRISTIDQKSDRQTQNSKDYDYVIEDKCSGATPFFERDGGKRIEKMILKNQVTSISVHQIDRLGRNLLDILNVISYFNKKGICIHFIQQNIKTLNEDGTEDSIGKMIISVLGVVAEMERNLIKERQLEGIAIAKYKDKSFLIVSNQQAHTFNIFDLITNAFIKEINLGTTETDGCDVTTQALGDKFPNGLFVSMNNNRNFYFHDLAKLKLLE